MSMVVSSVRFGTFVPKLQVRTASGSLTAPPGTKSLRMWALAPGGRAEGQGNYGYGGGGGEMRAGHVISIAEGQSVSFNVQTTQNTTITFNGSVIVQANTPPRYYTSSSMQGGTGGFGGMGRNGGSGSSGDVTYYGYEVAQGGGAGGADAAGTSALANGSSSYKGTRGSGRSFTDTETGVTYTNGSGSQLYGGGSEGGAPGDQYIKGGFVAFEWLNVELQSQVRAMSADGSVTVPSWAVRAELFVLTGGNNSYSYYNDEYDYGDGGGTGGYMYIRQINVSAGQTLSYSSSRWKLNGNTAVDNSLYDRQTSGGYGESSGQYRGGGAAGTDGNAQGYSRGPGRSFTDATSGQTFLNGNGGENYGGGQNLSGGPAGVGFGAVVFYSL